MGVLLRHDMKKISKIEPFYVAYGVHYMADEYKTLPAVVSQCIDTTENWETINPKIPYGTMCIEDTTDNKKRIKIGDGIHVWNDLPYFPDDSALLLPATETTYGFVRKGSIAEVLQGLDNDKYLTPLTHDSYHLQSGHRPVPPTSVDTFKMYLKSGNSTNSEYWDLITPDDVDAAPSSHVGEIGSAHGLATVLLPGFFDSTEKLKLSGVAPGANNYVHPTTHPASMIAEDSTHLFVSASEKSNWNAKQNALGFTPENPSNKNIPNGYAGLDVNGLLSTSVLPAIAVTDVYEASSDAAMLALVAQTGDICVRTDQNKSYVLSGDPTVLSNWKTLRTPTDLVLSVNGKTGAVVLSKSDIGLGNVDNTSDLGKPISAATQISLDTKAPLSHVGAGTGAHALATTAADGFLSKEDKIKLNGISAGAQVNTVDSVSGKTGVVVLTKADVGLDQVDNTSDLSKPVSTAVQTALNAKVNVIRSINGITLENDIILTTANISDSTDKRYLTDAQRTVVTNTAGTNTGDETATTLGTKINNSTAKTTLASNDLFAIADSAASYILRKLTWTSLKANIKTYTDTLYNLYVHPTNHLPSIITQDASNRFVNDVQIASWDAKQNALGFTPEDTANKNVANGYAGLDANGKLLASTIPAVAITNTFVASSQAEMLALSLAQTGDICVRNDLNRTFCLSTDNYSILADWVELKSPTDAVTSVNGKTGVVTVTKSDVGLDQVDNTSDLNKPISTATQTALNDKVPTTRRVNSVPLSSDIVLTTADISDSTGKRYLTETERNIIANTSGTNTGNETVTTVGYLLNGAAAKASPVDADTIPLSDSAATFGLKKITWASIKSTLKTYFDTLYNNYTHPNSGVTAGTYQAVTVNAQGHVTAGSSPTTLAGYGITDAALSTHTHSLFDGLLGDTEDELQSLGNVTGTLNINVTNGNVVAMTVTGALTLTLSGATSGRSRTVMLHITNGGAFGFIWPATITWGVGTAPALKSAGKSIVILNTINGGSSWDGVCWN